MQTRPPRVIVCFNKGNVLVFHLSRNTFYFALWFVDLLSKLLFLLADYCFFYLWREREFFLTSCIRVFGTKIKHINEVILNDN